MIVFFGRRWDAPIVQGASEVPVPVGERCYQCGEEIQVGDRGLLRPLFRSLSEAAEVGVVHMECDLIAMFGHEVGICRHTGYEYDARSRRAILAVLNAERAARGYQAL